MATQNAVQHSKEDIYKIVKSAVRDGMLDALEAAGFVKREGGAGNG